MESVDMSKDLEKIIKEGFLDKQSRYLKSWRKRWFVLTPMTLYTFKERKVYNGPTEALPLKAITSIKSCQDETQKQFTFVSEYPTQKIETVERGYYMCASSTVQKEQWIGQIGKAMVKLNARETQFE